MTDRPRFMKTTFWAFLLIVVLIWVACGSPQVQTLETVQDTVRVSSTSPSTDFTVDPSSILTEESSPLPESTTVDSTVVSAPTVRPAPTVEADTFVESSRTAVVVETTRAEDNTSDASAKRGGVFRLITHTDIAHQDVHFEPSPALSTWGPGIAYSRLLKFRTGREIALPNLDVVCDLCASWRSEDLVTFEFQIREGVRWHDDSLVGSRTLTADDVLYSLTRQLGGANGGLLGSIEDIEVLGTHTLMIRLAYPDADFMLGLADSRSKIVASEAVNVSGDLKNGPTIGTGPWRITATGSVGVHAFERFPNYFDAELPYMDGLEVHVVDDQRTREAAFIVSQIDVMEVTPFDWEVLKDRVAEDAKSILVPESNSGIEFALNPNRAPFNEPAVRRAALMATNPISALESVWLGVGYLSFGFPLIDSTWGLEAKDLIGHIANPDEARRILATFDLQPVAIKVGRYGAAYLAHANQIADELRAVGFNVSVEEVTQIMFGDDVWKSGNYQAFLGPMPPVTSPNAYLFNVVHSAGRYYHGGPPDKEMDDLIELQASEYDPYVRRPMHKEIQRRMLESAVRFMPVTRSSVWILQPWVRNLYPNLAGFEYGHWAAVWIER